MIVAIVTFSPRHRSELSREQQLALFEATAPAYLEIPGLLRKYFIGNDCRAGGIYEWRSRADAEAFYTEAWRRRISDTYGTELRIEWYNAPCVVDSEGGRIVYAPEIAALAAETP